jgi:glutathione synthase/RimK-type ligase-like ATP-grasp enzyme
VRRRVLITRAGSGASNNLIRSIRAGSPSSLIVGCHDDPFVLKQSSANPNYLMPSHTYPDFLEALRHVIQKERIDLLIPTTDSEVKILAEHRKRIPCRLFLPRSTTIELCQDKYALGEFLRSRGVPAPATFLVTDRTSIDDLFSRLAPQSQLWCRIRSGSGSMGAIPVKSAEQVRAWITYWEEMRGIPASSFTVSEYLPGRDFACQSLWKNGKLILIKTTERLSYFGGGSGPSGVSSIGALHKTVRDSRVMAVSANAVRVLDTTASGAFSVDLKEDGDGQPCVTEINVGRFLTGTSIFDLTGRHNMASTYIHLALDDRINIEDAYDVAEDHYMVRDLDTEPGLFHADELYDGFVDVRSRRYRKHQ